MSGALHDEGRRRGIESALTDLAAGARPREDCPPPERIWEAIRGEGSVAGRRQLVDHTAGCAACAEAWRLAMEIAPRQAAAAVREPARRSPALTWWPVAVAAGLLAVVGVAFLLGGGSLFPPPQPVMRGAGEEIRALTGDGPVARAGGVLLRWTAGPEGTLYDVVVTDPDLEVVATAEGLADPELRIPEERLSDLPAGSSLLWRVEAQLPEGSRRASPTFSTRLE